MEHAWALELEEPVQIPLFLVLVQLPDKDRNGLHVACQSWLTVATWSAVLKILRPNEGSVGDSALTHYQCLLECAGVEGQV